MGGGMPNFGDFGAGLGGLGGGDPMFMNLLNTFAKDLMEGDPSKQEQAMD